MDSIDDCIICMFCKVILKSFLVKFLVVVFLIEEIEMECIFNELCDWKWFKINWEKNWFESFWECFNVVLFVVLVVLFGI